MHNIICLYVTLTSKNFGEKVRQILFRRNCERAENISRRKFLFLKIY